ncbi:unnamed protein product [Camellia sinensis]
MAAAATFGATNTTTATVANKEYDYYRSFNHDKSSCSLLTPPRHHHNSPLRSRLFPHLKMIFLGPNLCRSHAQQLFDI